MNFGLVGDYDRLDDIEDLAHDMADALRDLALAAGVTLSARSRGGRGRTGADDGRRRTGPGTRELMVPPARRPGRKAKSCVTV